MPLAVSDVYFSVDGFEEGWVEFKTKVDDRDWEEHRILLENSRAQEQIHSNINCDVGRNFSLELTNMPDSLKIKDIIVSVEGYAQDSRDS